MTTEQLQGQILGQMLEVLFGLQQDQVGMRAQLTAIGEVLAKETHSASQSRYASKQDAEANKNDNEHLLALVARIYEMLRCEQEQEPQDVPF